MRSLSRTWVDPQPVEPSAELRAAVGGHPLLVETLARRGIQTETAARAFLDPDCYSACPPGELPDLDCAVELLREAIHKKQAIWVWGDFDVDGQTSTTVLVDGLRRLGGQVRYHIPVRAHESHGLNRLEVEKILAAGVDLLITCDTGITAHNEVDFLRQHGVVVIVTDHHDLTDELPRADAVIDSKRLPETHPLRQLPGVGVAYQVIAGLAAAMERPEVAAEQLDLVALGIVADLAVQRDDTRYLLQRGLARLRETPRLGLKAMFELANLNQAALSEEHIGFMLGPRLNALGRLSDANPAVEFFTTGDVTRARTLAAEMEGLNAQRRLLVDQVYQAAMAQIERDPGLLSGPGLVLAHPAWPAGVIGIVASRLVEQYQRPTILLAAPQGETARGSARSVEGVHVTEAIAACKDLLLGFGGHPMAAGLGMEPEKIDAFRRAFNHAVADQVGDKPLARELTIDRYLNVAEINLDLVQDIERLAPFGPGNPALMMASRGLTLAGSSSVGRNGEHLQLIVEDETGKSQRVIWWQGAGQALPEGRFDLAYVLRSSDFRGQREVQVEWIEARVVETRPVELRSRGARLEAVDYRREPNQAALLRALLQADPQVQVWREVDARVPGKNRFELQPGLTLAIWSVPPGNSELQNALAKVAPGKVFLFSQDSGLNEVDAWLKRLAGLLKFTLVSDGGITSLPRLSAAMGHRPETVLKGLEWMEAKSYFSIETGENETLRIGSGKSPADPIKLQVIQTQLSALLAETLAYRQYYIGASPDGLLPIVKRKA